MELKEQFEIFCRKFSETPIIVMGSKRHLLTKMFAVPEAPLFNFGVDLDFKPIEYKTYWAYMQERFEQKNITISLELSTELQDLLMRVPEPINMVCSHLLNDLEDVEISISDISEAIKITLEGRKSRFPDIAFNADRKRRRSFSCSAKKRASKVRNGKRFS